MATLKVLKYFWLIFFLKSSISGQVKAELRLSNSHIENDADQIVHEMDLNSKISSRGDFKLTKLLDIRFGENYENLHPDLRELVRSEVKKVSTGDPNSQLSSLQTNKPTADQYSEGFLKNMTDRFSEISHILEEVKCEISEIKENVSNTVNHPLSNGVAETEQRINTLVGVDIKPFCQCSHDENIFNSNPKPISKGTLPKNCKEIQTKGNNVSGNYKIQPTLSAKPFMVLCDMETRGGGWTHIQKRFDGSQDFFLGWREYKFGFGDLTGEFWIGLENIYLMTWFGGTELLVEIVDRDQVKAHAHYKAFAIGPEAAGYPLKVLTGFSGDAGDSLTPHLGSKFTTKDFDQDTNPGNCATMFSGAWWYYTCHVSNLNGKYLNVDLPSQYKYHGLHWAGFRSHEYCHAKARMLVRPSQS